MPVMGYVLFSQSGFLSQIRYLHFFVNQRSMRKVIIATDFSPASEKAIDYGCLIASKLNLPVCLIHVYSMPILTPAPQLPVSEEAVLQAVKEEMARLKERVQTTYLLPVHITILSGDPASRLQQQVTNKDILVMGMKGSGKTVRLLFGSVTNSLKNSCKSPLIVVPEYDRFQQPNKIALAVEPSTVDATFNTDILVELGRRFQSKILIIKVLKSNQSIVNELVYRSKHLSGVLKDLNPEYRFPRSDDVPAAIVNVCETEQVNLLVMIPQHHTLLDKISNVQETRKLLFHTHIPLLFLPLNAAPSVKSSSKRSRQLA